MTTVVPRADSEARNRLLRVASDLFYRDGIHSVGLDRILKTAAVTRATMYRHFAGKEALVAAYLEREDAATRTWFTSTMASSATPPHPPTPDESRAVLDAVIQGIMDDIESRHDRGCPFINAAAEYPDPNSAVRRIITAHRTWLRESLRSLLVEADAPDPDAAADALVLLRDSALIGCYLDGTTITRATFLRLAHLAVTTPADH